MSFVSRKKGVKKRKDETVIGSSSWGGLIAEIIQKNGKYFFVIQNASGHIFFQKPCKDIKEARAELTEFNRMKMMQAFRRSLLSIW
ncbi:MAG: hypothetical protein Q6363_007990 [Candidatus Njordarchaeota archaeon]